MADVTLSLWREKMEDKVDVGGDGECWEWEAGATSAGYGQTGVVDGEQRLAHRYSYRLAHGEDPGDDYVLHDCDNPLCVNPHHLHRGDQRMNLREAMDRGRHNQYGESHTEAKLSADDVRRIRDVYGSSGVTQEQLADEYGVTRDCVGKIIRRDRWDHV